MELQPHIQCKEGDVGKVVLLPGDSQRCKLIANLLDNAQLVASNREFVTYTGENNGIIISCTSTGIGCPSTSIAVEELINIGAKVLIRVGTCGAFQKDIYSGDLIIVTAAVRGDGTSEEYVPIEFPAVADFEVVKVLIQAAKELNIPYKLGIIRTHDAFYVESPYARGNYKERVKAWAERRVLAVENESATIFVISSLRGVKAGTILTSAGNLVTGAKVSQRDIQDSIENMCRVSIKASEKISNSLKI
jgi:uridine phosphorylase